MKGTVHAAIGASAPAGLVLTGAASIPQGIVMSAVSAGFALLPDIDTPNALASKALGAPVHKLAHWLSLTALEATALPRDASYIGWMRTKGRDPAHRSLTHTLAVTAVVGIAAYLAALSGGLAAGAVAAFGVFLLWPVSRAVSGSVLPWLAKRTAVLRAINRAAFGAAVLGAVVFGAALAAVGAALLLSPWLLALSAGGGYLSHLVADACTAAGVPLLWPLRIKNKRWWNIRILGGRVLSGSDWEKGPALGVAFASNALLLFLML